jgi:phage gp29-like protein
MSYVDAYGQAVNLGALSKTYSNKYIESLQTRRKVAFQVELDPAALGVIWREADMGDNRKALALADMMMERDPHYSAVMKTRYNHVLQLDKLLEANSDAPDDVRAYDLCMEAVKAPEFTGLLWDLCDEIGKGIAVPETLWDTSEAEWRPKGYRLHDPALFVYNEKLPGEIGIRTGEKDSVRLPPWKFIVHKRSTGGGKFYRGGVARVCSSFHTLKAWTVRYWSAFSDRFGMPMPIGKHPSAASDEKIDKFEQALLSIAQDYTLIMDENMQVEILSPTNIGGNIDLYERLCRFCDEQMSKAVLLQTMMTEDGSSRAQSEVHERNFLGLIGTDGLMQSLSIARDLLTPLVQLNLGANVKTPRFRMEVANKEDLKLMTESLLPWVEKTGLQVIESEIREKFNLEKPGPQDRVLSVARNPEKPLAASDAMPNKQLASAEVDE